ncbi:unnamed protein product, partial [Prunus brigantina]
IWVLGNKSPIQRVQGLESTWDLDPEYILSGTQETASHSATPSKHQIAREASHYSKVHPRRSPRRTEELPSRDPVICLIL